MKRSGCRRRPQSVLCKGRKRACWLIRTRVRLVMRDLLSSNAANILVGANEIRAGVAIVGRCSCDVQFQALQVPLVNSQDQYERASGAHSGGRNHLQVL